MSNTEKISKFLSNVSDIFTGDYNHSSEEIQEMRKEILDISSISRSHDDKIILRDDINNFLKDTKKSRKRIKRRVG